MIVLKLSILAKGATLMNQISRDWRLPLLVTACAGLAVLLFPGAGVMPLRAQGEQ